MGKAVDFDLAFSDLRKFESIPTIENIGCVLAFGDSGGLCRSYFFISLLFPLVVGGRELATVQCSAMRRKGN